MSTWRQCNTADEDDRFCLAVCRDVHTWTIIHVDIRDISRWPRWRSLHPIVREPHMVLCRMPIVLTVAAKQSGRPRALSVGRFEDGWLNDRPCRHVGRLYVSGDTTRGLEISIAWPQARCPRQIVSSTPRHSHKTASRSETRSERRRTDM